MKDKISDFLIGKYGVYINVQEMARVLKITPGALHNLISAGKFPVTTWKPNYRRIASTEEFAEYLSKMEREEKSKFNRLREELGLEEI